MANLDRSQLISNLFARAKVSDRRVWAYDSDTGHGGVWTGPSSKAGAIAPRDIDRACVEGDKEWTLLPAVKESK
jgi:hypothetical protein